MNRRFLLLLLLALTGLAGQAQSTRLFAHSQFGFGYRDYDQWLLPNAEDPERAFFAYSFGQFGLHVGAVRDVGPIALGLEYGYLQMMDIWGREQSGHFRRVEELTYRRLHQCLLVLERRQPLSDFFTWILRLKGGVLRVANSRGTHWSAVWSYESGPDLTISPQVTAGPRMFFQSAITHALDRPKDGVERRHIRNSLGGYGFGLAFNWTL